MTASTLSAPQRQPMQAGLHPLTQVAALLLATHALIWAVLLGRWVTFSRVDWTPLPLELALAQLPGVAAYLLFGLGLAVDLLVAVGLIRGQPLARTVGSVRAGLVALASLGYFLISNDFYGAIFFLSLSGIVLLLLTRQTAWALAYPAAFWLVIFFILPMLIVLVVSFGERTRLGTVTYPPLALDNLGIYFNDYVRFFSPVSGDFIYLRIFWRSLLLAATNTLICLIFSYPFAYWIVRRPPRYRNLLIFLVMIPFWTNFLVRTYAWMLILRDTGVINNFWTMTLHDATLTLAGAMPIFEGLVAATSQKLPLLFNSGAVMLGLFYGYFPFMVLPLYSNLEKIDWSLLEAAADLGANPVQSTLRVLLPLSLPGIVAGSIIVFIPSLGAYVTPDLLGGAKVSLLGNLLQQQFMTVRDWPFGSAIGFIMMAIMLAATLFYFRLTNPTGAKEPA